MRAVLLAAGRGTRMGALTADTPKPLLAVAGKPILAHILEGMAAAGVRHAIVVTGYLGERIEAAFGDGGAVGLPISYRRQERPSGTAGALLLARDLLGDAPFLLSWGDILVDSDLYRRMLDRFAASPCDVLLAVNPVDDPWRGGAVYVDADGRVERIVEKPARGTSTTGWNNAGIFVFTPLVLDYAARLQPSPRGELELPQAIGRMVEDGRDVRAVPVGELWSDVGTPDDLRAVDLLLRRRRLLERFQQRYGAPAEVFVRAPGRVNLIGEHTDYNGLPVLPIAIDREVLLAARARADRRMVLANAEPRFPERAYDLEPEATPFAAGDWGNYHEAAALGLLRHLPDVDWRGGEFLADGNLPTGAGLSSSSALVVAASLALLALAGRQIEPRVLAEVAARAERFVGTLSGGMDQAASLLGRQGHALRIDFFPLRVHPVPLPPGVSIVVCHSLVEAEKSGAARRAYNTRVIECRLACAVLERILGDALAAPLARLGDLSNRFPERPLASFVEPLADRLAPGELALDEVARAAGLTVGELAQRSELPAELPERFAVLARARHVLTEADRVGAAVAALEAGDPVALGALMDASHESCRRDYEVSCEALDELVETARAAGALGARLTGAGFGGCTVNLVRSDEVATFLEQVDRNFYAGRCAEAALHRFVFSACDGATVEHLGGKVATGGRA